MQIIDSGAIFWSLTRSFGGNLRELRKPKYKRSKDFAEALGVTPAIVSRWERDGTGPPEAGTLIKIATALACSIDDLLDGVDGYAGRDLVRQTRDLQSGLPQDVGGPLDDATAARLQRLEQENATLRSALDQIEDVARQLGIIATHLSESREVALRETSGGRLDRKARG